MPQFFSEALNRNRLIFKDIEEKYKKSPEKYVKLIMESEERFRHLYQNITDGIMIVGLDYRIYDVNERTCEITGFSKEELIGSYCDKLCPKGSKSKECLILEKHQVSFTAMDTKIKCKDSSFTPILKNAKLIELEGKKYICESFSDISYQKKIEEELTSRNNQLYAIIESAPIGIGLLRDFKFVETNELLAKILDYDPEELIGVDCRKFYSGDVENFISEIRENDFATKEVSINRRDGKKISVLTSFDPLNKDNETSSDVVVTVLDITENKKAQHKIWKQAYFDKLTGLPNRAYLLKKLEQFINKADEISLILFDLNRFKEVNDNYGHAAGDELLRHVAESLNSFIKEPDFAGRLGGDEFVIIVHTRNEEQLNNFCKHVCKLINRDCHLKECTLNISASLGVVSEAHKVKDFLLRADLAMYEAKRLSKTRPEGSYEFFTFSMLTAHEIQAQMKKELMQAFVNNQFDISFQPIYNINKMELEGIEALLRWNHPKFGEVPPQSIIPIADETGVLIPIGRWMLEEIGKKLHDLNSEFPQIRNSNFYISINMTLQQLSDPDLIDVVKDTIAKYNITGDMIMIDINDTAALEKSKFSLRVISDLKKLGISISINDFGIGYSALSSIESSSINVLKIDKGYIAELHKKKNLKITKAVIRLAKALKLGVVASGVENFEQFEKVRNLKCDAAQGFYLNKPLNGSDLSELIYNIYN